MSYINVYPTRINWENEPSINTPINETNLNKMDYALYQHDQTLANWDTTKANQSDLLLCVKTITYDTDTGEFVFTWQNGTTQTVDLNIEKIPVSFSMNAQGVITMTTEDGTQYTADVGSLIKTYTFTDSTVIDFTVTTDVDGNKTVTAGIVDGSITGTKLQPNYLADCTAAKTGAETAQGLAEDSAEDAEAWAVGERGGVPVPSTDPTYHNNAKYWAEQAPSNSLATLTDVDLTTPTDGQALLYDAANDEWVNGDVAGSASDITYDNTDSGLSATNAQHAIDEIETNVETKANSADVPLKTQITNPNLLDNPWFTVNQRGSNNYTADGYCVDRWYELNANVAVSDSGVTITKRSGTQYDPLIRQLIIPTKDLRGKTVTLSISVTAITANGGMNLYKASGINNDLVSIGGISFTTTGKYTVTASIPNDVGGSTYPYLLVGIDSYGTDCSLSVESVKLELGSISTLAMDTAPNYATELLKCQRYFYSVPSGGYFPCATISGGSKIAGCITLPCEMRTLPTLSLINVGSVLARVAGTGYTSSTAVVGDNRVYGNQVFIVMTPTTAAPANEAGCMFFGSGGTVQLSADL